jgi:hypothetical protein
LNVAVKAAGLIVCSCSVWAGLVLPEKHAYKWTSVGSNQRESLCVCKRWEFADSSVRVLLLLLCIAFVQAGGDQGLGTPNGQADFVKGVEEA